MYAVWTVYATFVIDVRHTVHHISAPTEARHSESRHKHWLKIIIMKSRTLFHNTSHQNPVTLGYDYTTKWTSEELLHKKPLQFFFFSFISFLWVMTFWQYCWITLSWYTITSVHTALLCNLNLLLHMWADLELYTVHTEVWLPSHLISIMNNEKI